MSASPRTTLPDRSTPSAEPPGISPSPRRAVWQFLDAAVFVGAWGSVVWVTTDYLLQPTAPHSEGLFIATLFSIPVFTAAWLHVRVLIPAKPFLDFRWRAQLAVTPPDPAGYLWRRLRRPFLGSVLALPLAQLSLLAAFEARRLSHIRPLTGHMALFSKEILGWLAFLSLFGAVYCIAVAGVFDQLRRQCARGGAYSPLGTLVWTAFSIVVPPVALGVVLILVKSLRATKIETNASVGLALAALCLCALLYARSSWRRACRMYFVLEPHPPPKIPGAGAEGWE